MKKIKFLSLVSTAIIGLALPAWAGPRGRAGGSGGSGHFSGGHVGGVAGGGSRAAPAFRGGGVPAAPSLRGTYYTGRSVSRPSAAPRFYYGGSRMSNVRPRGFSRSIGRSVIPSAGRVATANPQPGRVSSATTATRRQPNRVSSRAGRNRVSDPKVSTTRNREFLRNHASERHDANNWHRDWDRHHSHFHNKRVFVFVNGFWWGLYPWDYYPYYAYDYGYPYDDYGNPYYDYGSPYDYGYSSGNPYDYGYYNYSPYSDDDQPGYSDSGQSTANATVSAVQSELAKLGYYNGAIDGTLGDQTEAALARYQEDNDLSVTGTVDGATLQSLGIR
jgi:hypothetical protein